MLATSSPDEEMAKAKVALQEGALKKFGRSFEELTTQEQDSLFRSYEAQREAATKLADTPTPQGRMVGDLFLASSPWENLGAVAKQAAGSYAQNRANKGEAQGRRAASDLQTRRDEMDRQAAEAERNREDERRREWLDKIFAQGSFPG